MWWNSLPVNLIQCTPDYFMNSLNFCVISCNICLFCSCIVIVAFV